MEGYVLGPVRAEGGGGRRVVEGSKVAALFALLVTSPDCRCKRKDIAEVLWEGVEDVGNLVDRVVADLRKGLGQECVPHSGKSGYCTLRVPVGDVDLLRFREKVKQAEGLTCKAQFELLGAALEEWDGEDEPLQGLSEAGFHLRREELRAELMAAVYARLDAAYKSWEVKWLRDETEKWFERAPELPQIFRFYLLAHADLPEARRERLIKKWEKRNGRADVDVQSAIDQVRGEGRRPGGALLPPRSRPVARRQAQADRAGRADR